MKALKTHLLLPLVPEESKDEALKLVTVYLTKHPIAKKNFGGVQWRIAKRFYMITPKMVAPGKIGDISFYNDSDVCFLCSERPGCIGRPQEIYDKCHGRSSDVRIRHHSLDFDRFLLASLFDESSNLKIIRNWTMQDIYERRQVVEEMLRFCTDDLIPSRCDNCFLINQCPQSFKLRALTERCVPADMNWVRDRLNGAHCVKVNDSLSFDFTWMGVMGWWLSTYLIYKPMWICRDHSKVYGSRLIEHSFLKKTDQLNFWPTAPTKKIESIAFHPIQTDFEIMYALKSLARQARSLCVIGVSSGGNLGPFTKGETVSSILKEISYYWPIIQQALAQRIDVWNLSHMS